ncbi:MAG: L-rhamnose mutarotase [Clostridiales bacterium]|nr:L-rhamnose mutarotase [Clostridiales bacterium]
MKRMGQVLQVRPEKVEDYKKLHSQVWPEVKKMIAECNIKNYSIFLRGGFLFAYFEYDGSDYDSDMAKMAADPMTQKWWEECIPCQKPVDFSGAEEWWANMEEVFHLD